MSKINSFPRNWNDGDVIHASDYQQDREIIRVAINGTDETIQNHNKEVDPTSSDTIRDKHVSNNDIKTLQDQIDTHKTSGDHDGRYLQLGESYSKTEIDSALSNKQDKNTIGSKPIDETAIGNDKFLKYNASTGKIEYSLTPGSTGTEMYKSTYDTNNDGKVDFANDSDKLGGQLPSYYAKASDVTTNSTNISTLSGKVGDLTTLTTTAKTSAVAAINEVKSSSFNLGTSTYDIKYNATADSLDFIDKNSNAIVQRLYRDGSLKVLGQFYEVSSMKIGFDLTKTETTQADFQTSNAKPSLTNLLDTDGNCEDTTKFSYTGGTATLDSTRRTTGSNSIKVTKTGATTYVDPISDKYIKPALNDCYVFIANVYSENTATNVSLGYGASGVGVSGKNITPTGNTSFSATTVGSFIPVIVAYKVTVLTTPGTSYFYPRINHSGTIGNIFNVDGFRVYKITQAQYDALGTGVDLAAAQSIESQFPYVDSVTNPYYDNVQAISTGDLVLSTNVFEDDCNSITGWTGRNANSVVSDGASIYSSAFTATSSPDFTAGGWLGPSVYKNTGYSMTDFTFEADITFTQSAAGTRGCLDVRVLDSADASILGIRFWDAQSGSISLSSAIYAGDASTNIYSPSATSGSDFVGTIKVQKAGNSYSVYINGTLIGTYTSTTTKIASRINLSFSGVDGSVNTMKVNNVKITGGYQTTGTRITSYPLDAVKVAKSGKLNWTATTPTNTSLTIQTSLDGTTYNAQTNGGAITGITNGMLTAGKTLYVKQTLTTTDTTATPKLNDLYIECLSLEG